jgi:chromatin remodeling complex protein RSC6
MVRAAKQSTAPVAQMSTPTEIIAVVPDAVVPVVSVKKERKTATKTLMTEVVIPDIPVPVSTEEVVVPVSIEEIPVSEVEPSIESKMADFNTKLQQLSAILSATKMQFKVIEKAMYRELKAAKKSSSRKLKRAGNHKPSGFIRPTLISDELAEFLGKPAGTEMARTEVSKEINLYIRTNSLQDKTNGRNIIADEKLTKLLKLSEDDKLSYFNLQRYMKCHFAKTGVSAESVIATTEAVDCSGSVAV